MAAPRKSRVRSGQGPRKARAPEKRRGARPLPAPRPDVRPQRPIELPGEVAPDAPWRAGFCAIVGRPNVGKSTLLNRLMGEPLAIVTPKPQTTRDRLRGIRTIPRAHAQLILVDTPGLHAGRGALNKYMVEQALGALAEVDLLLYVVDAQRPPPAPSEDRLLDRLRQADRPTLLVLNKIDRVRPKEILLPRIEAWSQIHPFEEIVPVSAQRGDALDRLLAAIVRHLPESPPLFEPEMLTDAPERFLAAERVREQIYLLAQEEVPYAAAVTIDRYEERESDRMVHATIHVERPSQKAIVVGQGGRMIKEIGMRARQEIARLLGGTVHLKLFVRVDPDWTERVQKLRELGYA